MKRALVVIGSLLASVNVAHGQLNATALSRLNAGQSGVVLHTQGGLGGNALSITGLAATWQMASSFVPSDVLLVAGMAPQGSGLQLGSASRAELSVLRQAERSAFAFSASSEINAGAYVPASLIELMHSGFVASVLQVPLDGLSAESSLRMQAGAAVLLRGPAISYGAAVRLTRDLVLGRIAVGAADGSGAHILLSDEGIESALAIVTSTDRRTTRTGILGDLFAEARIGNRMHAGVTLQGVGVLRSVEHMSVRTLITEPQSINEFAQLVDTLSAHEDSRSTVLRPAQSRLLGHVRYHAGRNVLNVVAGSRPAGSGGIMAQLYATRAITGAFDLTAGGMITGVGTGVVAALGVNYGALRFDVSAAGDGGLRLEHARNLVLDLSMGLTL